VILPCLLPHADEGAVCAPGYRGRKRGEVVRTRTTALRMHTRQWVGTYAGKGNGDYRAELASALRAITAYMKHFAFSPNETLLANLPPLTWLKQQSERCALVQRKVLPTKPGHVQYSLRLRMQDAGDAS